MSFRSRLIVAFVAMTTITLGVSFAAIYIAVHRSEMAQLDSALIAEAHEEAMEIASLGGETLVIGEGPGPIVDDIGPLTKYAALYREDGSVLDTTDTFEGKPPALKEMTSGSYQPFNLRLDEELRGVLAPIVGTDSTLLLAAPRAHLEQDSRFLWRTLLLLLVVGTLASFALASWVIRRLTVEHQIIAGVVRSVASGDLERRVPIARSSGGLAQLGRDINEMIERLRLLLDTQRRFIAHASHELRSPLSLLYGEISLALRRPRTSEEYREALAAAEESTRELRDLAEELLDLARFGSDALPRDGSTSLGELIESALRSPQALHPNRSIELTIDDRERPVRGHPGALRRMLENLILNGLAHSPEGGTLRILTMREGDELRIFLADSGPGVREEDRQRIFEPFYRGSIERGGEREGTGLGLAIARDIARSHRGEIELMRENPYSAGALFCVKLPLEN